MASQLLIDNLPDIIRDETETIFLTACGMDINACDQNIPLQDSDAIYCTLNVSGDLTCSFFLCMPLDTVKKVIPLFLKVEILHSKDIIDDVACELLNLITGGVKSMINIQGLSFQLSVPSVRALDEGLLQQFQSGAIRSVGFDSTLGRLWAGVSSL